MWRSARTYISLDALIAALFLIAANDAAVAQNGASEGRRLADAWCTACHAVGPRARTAAGQPPSFAAIANRHGTTALSLKVFLKTSHRNMPNLIVAPDQADALADYILSLKTN
jgi:mono/diheme cytochrome c family protein